jgi:glycosyltransferase involved in cell wall biosynthesis
VHEIFTFLISMISKWIHQIQNNSIVLNESLIGKCNNIWICSLIQEVRTTMEQTQQPRPIMNLQMCRIMLYLLTKYISVHPKYNHHSETYVQFYTYCYIVYQEASRLEEEKQSKRKDTEQEMDAYFIKLFKISNKTELSKTFLTLLSLHLPLHSIFSRCISRVYSLPIDVDKVLPVLDTKYAHFFPRQTLVIFCASWNIGKEEWDFDSVHSSGLGGSEEAVVYTAQELAASGYWKVIVYGYPPATSKCTNPKLNPTMIPVREIRWTKETCFDVIVCWRDMEALPMLRQYCKKLCFWSHDSAPEQAVTLYRTLTHGKVSVDHIFFLSKFHRQNWEKAVNHALNSAINTPLKPAVRLPVPSYTFPNVTITSNGIIQKQFDRYNHLAKEPLKCIYASNYNQGLLQLLEIWPLIHLKYPTASLHIFFGWGVFYSPQRTAIETHLKNYTEQKLNVFEYGRVSHDRLAEEFSKAEYWIYPATVEESFCITAIKAQAAGCIPIVKVSGALTETIVDGYCTTKQEEFLSQVYLAFQESKSKKQETMRKRIQTEVTSKWTWSHVASSWNNILM